MNFNSLKLLPGGQDMATGYAYSICFTLFANTESLDMFSYDFNYFFNSTATIAIASGFT